MYKRILTIKRITTSLNVVGVIVFSALLIGTIIGFSVSEDQLSKSIIQINSQQAENFLSGYELFARIFSLDLSLLIIITLYILIAVMALLIISFFIGSISGLITLKKTKDASNIQNEIIFKNDSIIKLIFNGGPCLLLLFYCARSFNWGLIILMTYLGVMCLLEIRVLSLIKQVH